MKPSNQNKRILLVDDDQDFRELMDHRLKNLGFEVRLAETPQSFLKKMQEDAPDLCFIDIQLNANQVDGFHLIDFIRRKQKLSLPVLVISSLKDPQSVVHALELGANDYIKKPPYKERFQEILFHYLPQNEPSSLSEMASHFHNDLTPIPFDEDQKTFLEFSLKVKTLHEFGMKLQSSHLVSKGTTLYLKNGLLKTIFPEKEHVLVSVLSNSLDSNDPNNYELEVEFEDEERMAEKVRAWILNQSDP